MYLISGSDAQWVRASKLVMCGNSSKINGFYFTLSAAYFWPDSWVAGPWDDKILRLRLSPHSHCCTLHKVSCNYFHLNHGGTLVVIAILSKAQVISRVITVTFYCAILELSWKIYCPNILPVVWGITNQRNVFIKSHITYCSHSI